VSDSSREKRLAANFEAARSHDVARKRADGAWLRGWATDGARLAVWQHYTGAMWAWSMDLKKAGSIEGAWALVVRPVGQGDTGPPGIVRQVPHELHDWVLEPQLGEAG